MGLEVYCLALHCDPYGHLVCVIFLHDLHLNVRHGIKTHSLFCGTTPVRAMFIWAQLDSAVLTFCSRSSGNLVWPGTAAGSEVVRIAAQVFLPR